MQPKTKRSIDRTVVKRFIQESRSKGKTDQEIYDELIQEYFDPKALAQLIKGTVTVENKKKYSIYNNSLILLLLLSIFFKLFSVYKFSYESGEPLYLFLALIVPLFAVYFLIEVARYNGTVYKVCAWIMILGFLQSMSKSLDRMDMLINFALTIAIAVISFYLESKMFPEFNPKEQNQSVGDNGR